jgi:hypothetical protein
VSGQGRNNATEEACGLGDGPNLDFIGSQHKKAMPPHGTARSLVSDDVPQLGIPVPHFIVESVANLRAAVLEAERRSNLAAVLTVDKQRVLPRAAKHQHGFRTKAPAHLGGRTSRTRTRQKILHILTRLGSRGLTRSTAHFDAIHLFTSAAPNDVNLLPLAV